MKMSYPKKLKAYLLFSFILVSGIFLSFYLLNWKRNQDQIDIKNSLLQILSSDQNMNASNTLSFTPLKDNLNRVTFNLKKQRVNFVLFSNLNSSPVNFRFWVNNKNLNSVQNIIHYIDSRNSSENDESVAINYWKFVIDNTVHSDPTFYTYKLNIVDNPVAFLNNWGYGYCLNAATDLAQLLHERGYNTRIVQLFEHIVPEVFYQDKWHMLDPDKQIYFLNKDGQIASAEEIVNDRSLLQKFVTNWDPNQDHYYTGTIHSLLPQLEKAYVKVFYTIPVEKLIEKNSFYQEKKTHLEPNQQIIYFLGSLSDYYWSDFETKPKGSAKNGFLINNFSIRERLINIVSDFSVPVTSFHPITNIFLIYNKCLQKTGTLSISNKEGVFVEKQFQCRYKVSLSDVIPKGLDTEPRYNYIVRFNKGDLPDYLLTQFQYSLNSLAFEDGSNSITILNPERASLKASLGLIDTPN